MNERISQLKKKLKHNELVEMLVGTGNALAAVTDMILPVLMSGSISGKMKSVSVQTIGAMLSGRTGGPMAFSWQGHSESRCLQTWNYTIFH